MPYTFLAGPCVFSDRARAYAYGLHTDVLLIVLKRLEKTFMTVGLLS